MPQTARPTPPVTVVIPVLDDASRLDRCLAALEAQTYRGALEVIVVDNGSRDRPEEVVERHPRARLVHEARRSSYSARNTGVAEANGEVLAFTDSDCLPHPEWIERGVDAVLTPGGGGFVSGRVDVHPQVPGRPSVPELHDVLDGFPQQRYAERMHFGVTANIFVTRRTFDRVGPFHEGLISGGDMEWGQRAHAAGTSVRFVPGAVVDHPARTSVRAILRKSKRVQTGHDELRRRRGERSERRQLLRSALRPPIRTAYRRAAAAPALSAGTRMAYVALEAALHYADILFRLEAERRSSDVRGAPLVLVNVEALAGNPYLELWRAAATRSGAELRLLTKASVLELRKRPRQDRWVHLQWPERTLIPSEAAQAARLTARLLVLVAFARILGGRVLLTTHNVRSHDRAHEVLEGILWSSLSALVTDLHVMTQAGGDQFVAEQGRFRRARRHLIPHGHYAPAVAEADPSRAAQGERDAPTILSFGSLKRYKGIDELLDAYGGLPPGTADLHIVGAARDEDTAAALRQATTRPGVVADDRFIEDAELHELIRRADLVVLAYRRVLNSGSAMLALTLGTRVLVPRTPTFLELAEQVGHAWVRTFEGSLQASDLLAALDAPPASEPPDLSASDWTSIAEQLAVLWRSGASG